MTTLIKTKPNQTKPFLFYPFLSHAKATLWDFSLPLGATLLDIQSCMPLLCGCVLTPAASLSPRSVLEMQCQAPPQIYGITVCMLARSPRGSSDAGQVWKPSFIHFPLPSSLHFFIDQPSFSPISSARGRRWAVNFRAASGMVRKK